MYLVFSVVIQIYVLAAPGLQAFRDLGKSLFYTGGIYHSCVENLYAFSITASSDLFSLASLLITVSHPDYHGMNSGQELKQDRNLEVGPDAEAMRSVASLLAFHVLLACFLTEPRTTIPEVVLPTVG